MTEQNLPGKRGLPEQTKVLKALALGMLPNAHPDEMKVLLFLAAQYPSKWSFMDENDERDPVFHKGYRFATGGDDAMTQEQWASMLGMDRKQLRTALQRLITYNFIEVSGGGGANGWNPKTYALSIQFIEAALDWYTEVYVKDRLPYLVRGGTDPVEHYANRKKIARITLPKRPPRPPKLKASEKAKQRWSIDEEGG